MTTHKAVTGHYSDGGLADRIFVALEAAGKDIDNLTVEELSPLDHFHGRGRVATAELAAQLPFAADMRVLDMGSGIGGPARYIADTFGCHVTGIDLTPEFCATARLLNERTGMADRVTIEHGSATDLPFADAAFDGAYSQNVVMNIEDKAAFFAEAFRVVKPGGFFAASEVSQGPGGDALYPSPWAETAATSFLVSQEETRRLAEAAGFDVLNQRETTKANMEFSAQMREKIAAEGFPVLGVHVIMGPRYREMMRNTAKNVAEGRVIPGEIFCRRP